MISSVKSNIFEVTGESVLMLYGSHLTGAPTSTLLVLSETPLGDAALEALEKSAVSLEFGTAPLAQVVVETAEGKLGAEDVRTIVEGLAIFQDFEGMMNTPADKQRAWALLKKLR